MKCNIFNPLEKNNGDFYLFSQYADDCTREDALKTAYRVVPSHFAVLDINIPEVESVDNYIAETFQDYENRVLFLKGKYGSDWTPEMANNLLWDCMEEAQLITPTEYKTTTGSVSMTTYKELNFIGDINIYNAKRYNDMNYNEIYCHIGSSDRSKYYAIEGVGTRQFFDYEGFSLLGWDGLTVLPNMTMNEARVTAEGQYGVFGNYLPNTLNPAYNDRCIDVERPSSAEEITVNIKQEGLGTVFFQIGSGELEPVTHNDGEEFTFTMSSDVREVTVYPNTQNIFIDGLLYASNDTDMTGIGTVYQNTEKGLLIDPQVGSIRITNNNEDSFKLNTIVLFYDVYNNMDADNPQLMYRNVPMGVYFVGRYDEDTKQLKNTVTKYSNNDDVFGQGSSYNLRICTRNVVTPQGMLKYDTQVVGGEEGYDNLASVMGGLHDLIESTRTSLHSNAIEQQDIKDHLSAFKTYQTNVPYIRNVNGIPTWFVNGHNTGAVTSTQGIQGATGVQGPMGYAGSNGVQGVQGVQGADGKDGVGGGSSTEYLDFVGGLEINFENKTSETKIVVFKEIADKNNIQLNFNPNPNVALDHTILIINNTGSELTNIGFAIGDTEQTHIIRSKDHDVIGGGLSVEADMAMRINVKYIHNKEVDTIIIFDSIENFVMEG